MSDDINIVILAAGKGTRFKMDLPKPLAPLNDRVLIDFVIDSCKDFGNITLVTGHQENLVREHIEEVWSDLKISFVNQKEQLGTGHAVKTYFDNYTDANKYKYTIVACADTPLLTKDIFSTLIEEIKNNYKAVCASFNEIAPKGYGRIIRKDKGFVIVEEKDANAEQKLVTEVNSGLYIFETAYLGSHIGSLDSNNSAGEFYLTDTFKEGESVYALNFDDKNAFLGVNDLLQLSVADRKYRNRLMKNLLVEGVRILDLSHTYIYSSNIEIGTVIYPNCHIDSKSRIGKNVTIEPGCIIKNSEICDGAYIKAYTYITDSKVENEASVGPMAQLRPGSIIGSKAKVGNFVEVKNSKIGESVGLSHLSYVGDAQIGKNTNIGCGFITCNYDGANKHKTIIGENSFVGSDCQMIAPINIGSNSYIGSGSTVNQDVPDGAFAIARARQVTKADMAKKFIKQKKK